MPAKWSEAQHKKFSATMAAKKNGGKKAFRMPRYVYVRNGNSLVRVKLKRVEAWTFTT